jgi:hypothetical protein
MGFNGALFKEAWRHMGAEAKANPDKNDFIAPTAMKMAVARDADGFRVMNSFLKAGTASTIVGRVARFALLLLQVREAPSWPRRWANPSLF